MSQLPDKTSNRRSPTRHIPTEELVLTIEELKRWLFPSSEWEDELVRRIETLPMVTARRFDSRHTRDMGMLQGYCHINVTRFCRYSQNPAYQPVTGWMTLHEMGELRVYACHSVVLDHTTGSYYCITPMAGIADRYAELDFYPDPELVFVDFPDREEIRFRDRPVGVGVRRNPHIYRERAQQHLDLLRRDRRMKNAAL